MPKKLWKKIRHFKDIPSKSGKYLVHTIGGKTKMTLFDVDNPLFFYQNVYEYHKYPFKNEGIYKWAKFTKMMYFKHFSPSAGEKQLKN